MRYQVAYDRVDSTEEKPRYFVYDTQPFRMETGKSFPVIYNGSYAQCLCVVGALGINYQITIGEIRDKTNGFI